MKKQTLHIIHVKLYVMYYAKIELAQALRVWILKHLIAVIYSIFYKKMIFKNLLSIKII